MVQICMKLDTPTNMPLENNFPQLKVKLPFVLNDITTQCHVKKYTFYYIFQHSHLTCAVAADNFIFKVKNLQEIAILGVMELVKQLVM